MRRLGHRCGRPTRRRARPEWRHRRVHGRHAAWTTPTVRCKAVVLLGVCNVAALEWSVSFEAVTLANTRPRTRDAMANSGVPFSRTRVLGITTPTRARAESVSESIGPFVRPWAW
jgi:hypothetical protein